MRNLVFLLVLLAYAPVTLAESPAQSQDAGQSLVDRGTAKFKAGEYADALASFEEALGQTGEEGLHYLIGRCHEELGHLEESLAAYERTVRSKAPREAKANAGAGIKRVKARLSTGELVLEITPAGAYVELDGKAVGVAPVASRQAARGSHTVRARALGYLPATTHVDVPGGGMARATLSLKPDRVAQQDQPAPSVPARPAAESPPTTIPVTVSTASGGEGVQATWGWVTFGLGVSVAAAGGLSYGLGERDHLAVTQTWGYGTQYVTDMTRREALDLTESGDLKKTVGYALWGVGGAAVITGIVLVATDTEVEGVSLALLRCMPNVVPRCTQSVSTDHGVGGRRGAVGPALRLMVGAGASGL